MKECLEMLERYQVVFADQQKLIHILMISIVIALIIGIVVGFLLGWRFHQKKALNDAARIMEKLKPKK